MILYIFAAAILYKYTMNDLITEDDFNYIDIPFEILFEKSKEINN
jgi:hypothetical protein